MLNFGEIFIADIDLEAQSVRDLKLSAETVLMEMLPDTAETLELWEQQYGIVPGASATLEERRAVVIGAMQSRGGLSISYFESIAESFGYTIGAASSSKWLIVRDGIYAPFRAGVSKAGDKVYTTTTGEETYTWEVYGTDVETDTALIELFENLKPSGTTIEFTNA